MVDIGCDPVACYSPLKGFVDRATGGITFRPAASAGRRMEVACGQCLGCRLDYSRMWAARIVHEASLHADRGGNSFITLTYRDRRQCDPVQLAKGYHIHDDWSLHVDDFQRFMKRLRKATPGERVRFFHVGEYGEFCRHGLSVSVCEWCSVGRPHYHAILFNRSFPDRKVIGRRRETVDYTSEELEGLWKYGLVHVGDVTMQSAAYVARYCLKKVTGSASAGYYENVDEDGVIHRVAREYATMSRRPGVGRDWFAEYASDCFPSDEIPVPGVGVLPKVPRYYAELYGRGDPEGLEAVKARRQEFRLSHSEEYTPERLRSKYLVKKAQVGLLKREM